MQGHFERYKYVAYLCLAINIMGLIRIFQRFTAFLALFAAFSGFAQALDAPEITCITVDATGNVTLNWTQPADPQGEFTEYQIFTTDNGVDFYIIASIGNYNQTSFTIVGAGADSESRCFQMYTASFDGVPQLSPASGISCSLFMQAGFSNPDGYAVLAWNDPLFTMNDSWNFEIYMEFPMGIWTQIATVPVQGPNLYSHEVSTCGAWLNFRIRLDAGTGCEFVSNIDGNNYNDTTAPETPNIESVSVDSLSGNAVISWQQPSAGDTYGYIIYQCVSGFTLILDTLWGASNTVYENVLSNANVGGSESYAIAAFDTCFTGTPPSPNTSPTNSLCDNTMFLTVGWFPCQTTANLAWTPYYGWDNGVSYYEVFVKVNGGAPQLAGTVSGNANAYTFQGIVSGNNYKFFVKAHANGETYSAISNVFTVNVFAADIPSYLYLSTATVEPDGSVDIRVFMQSVPGQFNYVLQRKDRITEPWNEVYGQLANNVNFLAFNDNSADTDWQSFQYRILVEDVCGDSVGVSNIGKTIFASGIANSSDLRNTITWNNYLDWDGNVAGYRIYRTIEDYAYDELIGTTDATTLYFEDDVQDLVLTPGNFCYTVEAFENPNFLGIVETSRSNEICVLQEPKIWVPNAMVYNGVNNIFKPVIVFAEFDTYRFAIYNRWGDQIFYTEDILAGWDGNVGGKQSQEGMYHYYISLFDGSGTFHERRGAMYLLIGGEN